MAPKPYDERLERLLQTTAEVFARKGFHSTTMRDLARATGMSLAGIYHYVPDKDDLLFQIQQRCFEAVIEGAARAIRGAADDPRARVEAFIRHHVTFFTGHMSEMKVLSHEADSLSGERFDAINGLKRRYVTMLSDLVAPVADGADANVAAFALFGMMNWIYNWYDPEGVVTPDQLAATFARIFLDGAPALATASQGASL